MMTATPVKMRVSQLRFQCGTNDFAENEKGRQLDRAERDCIVEHAGFWVLLLAAIALYVIFGDAYRGAR
jgi:hypothetical protein